MRKEENTKRGPDWSQGLEVKERIGGLEGFFLNEGQLNKRANAPGMTKRERERRVMMIDPGNMYYCSSS